MRHALGNGALASVFALTLAPSSTGGQPLRTTHDMTALSPATADRVVRRDLLSILTPIAHPLSTGMRRRMDDVELAVRPYGTRFPGLCRMDMLEVKYAPVEAGPGIRDPRLQPYGLESRVWYRAVSVPRAPVNDYRAEAYIWSPECDSLAGDLSWFSAKDEDEAATSVNFLKAATDAVRAGKIEPASCDLPRIERRTCREVVLAEGDIGRISTVERCAAEAGLACYRIVMCGLTSFEITGSIPGDDTVGPTEVKTIKVGFEIVVT